MSASCTVNFNHDSFEISSIETFERYLFSGVVNSSRWVLIVQSVFKDKKKLDTSLSIRALQKITLMWVWTLIKIDIKKVKLECKSLKD